MKENATQFILKLIDLPQSLNSSPFETLKNSAHPTNNVKKWFIFIKLKKSVPINFEKSTKKRFKKRIYANCICSVNAQMKLNETIHICPMRCWVDCCIIVCTQAYNTLPLYVYFLHSQYLIMCVLLIFVCCTILYYTVLYCWSVSSIQCLLVKPFAWL